MKGWGNDEISFMSEAVTSNTSDSSDKSFLIIINGPLEPLNFPNLLLCLLSLWIKMFFFVSENFELYKLAHKLAMLIRKKT